MDWEIIGRISDILGILSFVVSIGLWVSFGQFKKELERQEIRFDASKKRIHDNLVGLKKDIFEDNIRDKLTLSLLRQQINEIEIDYNKFLKKKDSECVKEIIKIINNVDIDYHQLSIQLDWLITIFR